jgi:hypothetical protein
MPRVSSVPMVHRAVAAGFLALALVNFFFAGLGAFGAATYDAHQGVGSLLVVVALVLALLAWAGRRDALPASAALLALTLLQALLGIAGEDVGVLGGLHALNGLLVLFAAHQAMRGLPLAFGAPGTGESNGAPRDPRL